jgi:hypothetical protein
MKIPNTLFINPIHDCNNAYKVGYTIDGFFLFFFFIEIFFFILFLFFYRNIFYSFSITYFGGKCNGYIYKHHMNTKYAIEI